MPDVHDANYALSFILLRLNDIEQKAVDAVAAPSRRAIVKEAAYLNIVALIPTNRLVGTGVLREAQVGGICLKQRRLCPFHEIMCGFRVLL